MARWVNLGDCIEISAGEMRFYPVELLGDVYEDVAPVIHAHWIRKRMLSHDGELYCSNCEWTPEVIAVGGTTVADLQLADVYYCPHCGAKMDEEV